jgi:hypothetical protein
MIKVGFLCWFYMVFFFLDNKRDVEKSCAIFYPDSTWKSVWDIIGIIFIVYQSVVVPFRLCFEEDSNNIFDIIQDVYFVLDICKRICAILFEFFLVISLNTGYYQMGNLIMTREQVIKHYIKTWYW